MSVCLFVVGQVVKVSQTEPNIYKLPECKNFDVLT